MNQDERFSRDPCFVFLASYYIERRSIEQQINISGEFFFISLNEKNILISILTGMRGQTKSVTNGIKKLELDDLYDVYKKVKGSPKFWQVGKCDLVAKVRQLGPFHIFYTLCHP